MNPSPELYMAVYHAGMSHYALGQHAAARASLLRFLQLYRGDDAWTRNALAVLERLGGIG